MGMYGPQEDGIRCGKGVTKQSFADECDINQILAKYQESGSVTHLTAKPAKFGNFIGIPDYRESLDIVNRAQAAFMTLPAGVRERFANDPAKLLDFVADDKNRAEAEKLGLLDPVKAQGLESPLKGDKGPELGAGAAPAASGSAS